MKSILKSVLAILLGLGFLALQSRAQAPAAPKKAAIAFLGLTEASDPQISETIAKRIRTRLGADSSLNAIPGEEIEKLLAKGILRGPGLRPGDTAALRREVGDVYLASGGLERVAVASKRIWWKPWSMKNTWTQGMRLHVEDGSKGRVVLDSLVIATVREPGFILAPEGDLGRLPPLEREKRMRLMAEAVSIEAAKSLAKASKAF